MKSLEKGAEEVIISCPVKAILAVGILHSKGMASLNKAEELAESLKVPLVQRYDDKWYLFKKLRK